MITTNNVYKVIQRKLYSRCGHKLDETYHLLSDVYISNKTVSAATNHRISRSLNRPNQLSSSFICFQLYASTIMAEAITMIPTQTGIIDPRVVPLIVAQHFQITRISSAVITSTLERTLAIHTPFYGRICMHRRPTLDPTCDT